MKRYSKLSETLQRHRGRFLARATRRALGLSSSGGLLPKRRRAKANHDRRGSTLLVVMALLGMLLLLGMLYFTFATQEQQTATNFAEAAKKVTDSGDDIDAMFDEVIKQLIQGADPAQQKQSSLSYRHSLLGTLLGNDLREYSGSGVNVVFQSGSGLFVDQNHDGANDACAPGYNLLEPNDSPAARTDPLTGVSQLFERNLQSLPAPDVDYTYPDINNMFLAYKGVTWDFSTTPPTAVTVIKPSFHRPELLRDNNGQPIANWWQSTAPLGSLPIQYQRRPEGCLFRPHPNHLYVWRQNTNATPERRFLDPSNVADAAIIASLPGTSGGFPFRVDRDADGNFNEQGVWSRGTGITNAQSNSYDYDADTDNDGIYDSIWMDLDLPMLVRSTDNAKYIPLVALQVLDLDGLLNLNIHGNLSGDTQTAATTNFGNGFDISRSSMGLGPNEVNLLWGLDAMPGVDVLAANLTDHNSYFGHTPMTQLELGNMELWWLLTGRIQYTTPRQIFAGRFGEADRLWRVLSTAGGAPVITVNQTKRDYFPHAGLTWGDEQATPHTGGDDNTDANEGRQSWLGGTSVGKTLPFVHPLALGGRGRFWGDPLAPLVPKPKQLRLSQPNVGIRNTWIIYDSAGVGYDSNSGLANASWLTPFGGALMSNTRIGANYLDPTAALDNQLYHDTLEVTLEPKFLQRPIDEPLESVDTLLLQMTSGDRNRTGISSSLSSRITSLMPGSMTPLTGYQVQIGQRFTTDSWDPKTFGLPHAGYGPDGKPGRAGIDDDGDGKIDVITVNGVDYPDDKEFGWAGSDDVRPWEFNVDLDRDGLLEFPPQFNPVLPPQAISTDPPYLPAHTVVNREATLNRYENAFGNNNLYPPSKHIEDPFRPQLRRLLYAEFGDTKDLRQPMRLSVNEFLDVERRPGTPGNVFTSPLQYRSLSPHSTDTSVQNLPTTGTTLPPYPPAAFSTFSVEEVKEYWARRDRQQMARDIYVMLYTFCGGNDSMNVTTTSGFTVYPINVRRQMAHFAVNLVDALDRDNVITAFEFDHDLSNGWNLDDDPTTDESGTLLAGEREVIYGVEAQELTISETLWLYQDQLAGMGDPQPRTPFNESASRHNFVQIELRATSPTPVNLASTVSTTAATGIWRILRDDNNNGVLDVNENALIFLNGNPPIDPAVNTLFSVASSDSSTPLGTACLYIDTAGSTTDFEIVAPNKAVAPLVSGTPPTTSAADLDVLFAGHAGRFVLATGSGGDFLSKNNNPDLPPGPAAGSAKPTTFRLERRMNPNLPKLPLGANPYVSVDVSRNVPGRDLRFDPAPPMASTVPPIVTQADAISRLSMAAGYNNPGIQSQERREPLDGNNIADCSASGGPSVHKNTIGQNNSNSPPTFNLFHAHFDRDFASIVELFQIPLRGANGLTRSIVNARRPASLAPTTLPGMDLGQLGNGGNGNPGLATFGAAVLLETEDVNHDGALAPSDDTNGNGIQDAGETDSNGITGFDFGEDLNKNGVLDSHPYHFHRLLSLVEVPTRTHRQLGDPLKVDRIPGKINLNNVRDPRVLGALIDDRQVIGQPEHGTVDINSNGQIDTGLADQTGDQTPGMPLRDWWYQFLIARDGQALLDPSLPYNAATNPRLPPVPLSGISRPFRDLGLLKSSVQNQSVIEDTILRKQSSDVGPISPNSPSGRGLFDLATETEFTAPLIANQIDPYIRQRLLSKVIGNTTTRSNVFIVFATIGMFECYENAGTGTVRIGGALKDLPPAPATPIQYRAAFIIDRSQAMEAYDKGTGGFDWKKLMKARQRIN